MHKQKEDNNQSKINKQPEVPENQTAWNSENQGIKETVNKNNQTCKKGGWRETAAKQLMVWAGLAEQETETQSWLWTMVGVATWEKLPFSHESLLESGLETSRELYSSLSGPLPHR